MDLETTHQEIALADFRTELVGLGLPAMLRQAEGARLNDAHRVLSRAGLGLEEIAVLLKVPASEILDDLVERACAQTELVFHKTILLYAPWYLSSFCVNHCLYCGFNFTVPMRRRWLSPPRALDEVRYLTGRGFKKILFVAGESPAIVDPAYLEEIVRNTRSLVPEIDLEVGPVGQADYRRLQTAGADGVVCYQETYDRGPYAFVHPRGPKYRYEHRLHTLERAGSAGMRRLGLGILLGLADPAQDVLAMIAHARFLGRRFPEAQVTVSLPRLCPAVPSFRTPWHVEDEQMLRFFAVLRLALPHVGMVVTTREPEWLRTRLLRAGITQMSAESMTVPGAYTECGHEGGQFEVQDHRTVNEVRWDVEDLGFQVV